MTKTYGIAVDCASCAMLCETEICKISGVVSATVNFMAQKLVLEFAEGVNEKQTLKQIEKSCRRIEPDFEIES